jgi:hypothetical protein
VEHAQPGEAVSGVLVSGDMSTTGMGTVTYNDGKRIRLRPPVLRPGPADMLIAKGNSDGAEFVVSPELVGNATEVVGALRQDPFPALRANWRRSSGDSGACQSRAYGDNGAVVKEKDLNSTFSCNRSGRRS